MTERFLVTGALGCIGAWTLRLLAEEGVPVVAFDIGTDRSRLELVASSEQIDAITFAAGDLTDPAALDQLLDEHDVNRVVHLAALLVPAARANPARAAAVNVVGTVNVFEAVRRRLGRIPGVAYASTAAVYDLVDGVRVAEDAVGHPSTHYGVHKQANEGTARVYWLDEEVPSIGLRPCVVYGPGRDGGASAGPTLAMRAAARGESATIPFGGRLQFHYAPDVARAFIAASRSAREGAIAANLGGTVRHMGELVAAIEAAAPEAAGSITFDDVALPNPEMLEAGAFPVDLTPLEDGVRATIEHFRAADRVPT